MAQPTQDASTDVCIPSLSHTCWLSLTSGSDPAWWQALSAVSLVVAVLGPCMLPPPPRKPVPAYLMSPRGPPQGSRGRFHARPLAQRAHVALCRIRLDSARRCVMPYLICTHVGLAALVLATYAVLSKQTLERRFNDLLDDNGVVKVPGIPLAEIAAACGSYSLDDRERSQQTQNAVAVCRQQLEEAKRTAASLRSESDARDQLLRQLESKVAELMSALEAKPIAIPEANISSGHLAVLSPETVKAKPKQTTAGSDKPQPPQLPPRQLQAQHGAGGTVQRAPQTTDATSIELSADGAGGGVVRFPVPQPLPAVLPHKAFNAAQAQAQSAKLKQALHQEKVDSIQASDISINGPFTLEADIGVSDSAAFQLRQQPNTLWTPSDPLKKGKKQTASPRLAKTKGATQGDGWHVQALSENQGHYTTGAVSTVPAASGRISSIHSSSSGRSSSDRSGGFGGGLPSRQRKANSPALGG